MIPGRWVECSGTDFSTHLTLTPFYVGIVPNLIFFSDNFQNDACLLRPYLRRRVRRG